MCVNVRGFNNPDKRRTLRHWLKRVVRADISLLSETHCDSQEKADQWTKEWSGLSAALQPEATKRNAYFSISSSPHTGGTAVLLHPDFVPQVNVTKVSSDTQHQGAWTSILMNFDGKVFQIDALYMPVDPSLRVPAIEDYFSACHSSSSPDTLHIAGGDINCVEEKWRDVQTLSSYPNRGGDEWLAQRASAHLMDAWLHHCPDRAGFTRAPAGSTTKTRIDRLYLSTSITSSITDVNVALTPSKDVTDHDGVVMELKFGKDKGKQAFWRLNSSILNDPATVELVHTAWEWWLTQRGSSPLLHWWLQWKEMIAQMLKSQSEALAAVKRATLKRLQQQFEHAIDYDVKHQLKEELAEYLFDRAEKAQLRAGAHREVLGDTPTATFYAQAAVRASKQKVVQLTTPAGVITDKTAMAQHITDFWADIFGEHLVGKPRSTAQGLATLKSIARIKRTLSPTQIHQLNAPITMDELEVAVKKGWADSAPGGDGLPRRFYLRFWHLFQDPLLELALCVQDGHVLSQSFNRGVVALLPKTKSSAPETGHFRPITLLNIDYKIIAGIIAGRIKVVIPSLVHETQTGFVPERNIFENLTFIRDAIDWSVHTRTP